MLIVLVMCFYLLFYLYRISAQDTAQDIRPQSLHVGPQSVLGKNPVAQDRMPGSTV